MLLSAGRFQAQFHEGVLLKVTFFQPDLVTVGMFSHVFNLQTVGKCVFLLIYVNVMDIMKESYQNY